MSAAEPIMFECEADARLDIFVSQKLRISRSKAAKLIEDGAVLVADVKLLKPSLKLRVGQVVQILHKEEAEEAPKAAFDEEFDVPVIYEDDDILILNKPASLVTHPADSVNEPTLAEWLKLCGFALSRLAGEGREGIVHRLDKDTTGAIAVAKTDAAYNSLKRQLESKKLGRYYLAVIDSPLKQNCTVEAAVGRDPKNRLRKKANVGAKEAKTRFLKLLESKDGKYELVAAKLYTGRTHQIRAHLKSLHKIIIGDSLYGFKCPKGKIAPIKLALHAYILHLIHPKTKEFQVFVAPLYTELEKLLAEKFDMEMVLEKLKKDFIISDFDADF